MPRTTLEGSQMLRIALVLFAFVLATAGAASAQTVRQVLKDFGLLGTWQTDCGLPPASNNFRTIYAGLPNGRCYERITMRPARFTASSFSSASAALPPIR